MVSVTLLETRDSGEAHRVAELEMEFVPRVGDNIYLDLEENSEARYTYYRVTSLAWNVHPSGNSHELTYVLVWLKRLRTKG